jgi:hypothetical protein
MLEVVAFLTLYSKICFRIFIIFSSYLTGNTLGVRLMAPPRKNLLLRNHGGGQAPHRIAAPVKKKMVIIRSRVSSVGTATGYWLDGRGIGGSTPGRGKRLFFSLLWGSPSFLSNVYQGLFPPGVNWQRREADHSTPVTNGVTHVPPLPMSPWCGD